MQREFNAINHLNETEVVIAGFAACLLTVAAAALVSVSRLSTSVLLSAGICGDGNDTNDTIAWAIRELS